MRSCSKPSTNRCAKTGDVVWLRDPILIRIERRERCSGELLTALFSIYLERIRMHACARFCEGKAHNRFGRYVWAARLTCTARDSAYKVT